MEINNEHSNCQRNGYTVDKLSYIEQIQEEKKEVKHLNGKKNEAKWNNTNKCVRAHFVVFHIIFTVWLRWLIDDGQTEKQKFNAHRPKNCSRYRFQFFASMAHTMMVCTVIDSFFAFTNIFHFMHHKCHWYDCKYLLRGCLTPCQPHSLAVSSLAVSDILLPIKLSVTKFCILAEWNDVAFEHK